MRDFIKQKLSEAIKSQHWKEDSYPTRIWLSNFDDLGEEHTQELKKRVKFLESLEFTDGSDKIGVWLYESPVEIKHPPYSSRDKGTHLLAIVNGNSMTTLYWKHVKEGEYQLDINFDELVEFSKSDFYDPVNMPINIGTIEMWRDKIKADRRNANKPKVKPQPNLNKFKKLKLNDGQVVKYYPMLNKFESLEGQPIKVDDIFDNLPEHIQSKVMELLENRK